MKTRPRLLLMAHLVCLATLIGCSHQGRRVSVAGKVSLDGEPVEDGQVAFEPVGDGKMEFGIISGGEYLIPTQYGLTPGEYVVRITGNRATGKQAKPDSFLNASEGDSLDIQEQFIPPQFNVGSTLKIQVEPVDHLEKDFTLNSK